MIDSKLLGYIKRKTELGSSREEITSALLKAGWDKSEIEEGFSQLSQTTSTSPVPDPLQKVTGNEQASPKTDYSPKFSKKTVLVALALVIVMLLISGGFYLYSVKSRLFGIAPYTEKNLLSGLLNSASKINSSSYAASASLIMGKRDADAESFTTKLSNADEIKTKYQNDTKRARDINAILSQLIYRKGGYPISLKSLMNSKSGYSYYSTSITDPTTQQPYGYTVTDNGNNFLLMVTFETSSAISQIRKSYKFSDTATMINGKTITFTKDSSSYFYLSPTPPKSFLVTLADYMAYIPPETKASASISAQSDWSNKDAADWKFNVDTTGDFGDLAYKFNIDALKKDSIYYLKINNMPSFFFSYIGFEKGQWIKVDPSKTPSSNSSYYGYSYLSKELPNTEKYYKEHRKELTDLLHTIVTIADDEKLITLKHSPYREKVDDRDLYRYDLAINKDAIVPFYQRLLQESNKTSIHSYYPYSLLTDSGYLEYLQSPEFSEVFDYYQKNTTLTLWVDSQGFLAVISYSLRIVPPDPVTQLKDKQANVVFKLVLSDVNKPIDIQAPTDAKNLEDALQSNPYFQQNKDVSIKGNMATLLTNGAVYYDTNGNYNYWCSNEKYYTAKKAIDDAYGIDSMVTCKCNTINCVSAQKWCTSALLDNGDYYCVDSSGTKTESTSASICSSGSCGISKNSQTYQNQNNAQGLKIETLSYGSGSGAQNGDTVTVNYVGTLQNGTKFDSTYDRNAPFTFKLGVGKVIKGFDSGILGMKVGEKRRLTIPPELGYGSNGFPPKIPSNSTLIFEINLVQITH